MEDQSNPEDKNDSEEESKERNNEKVSESHFGPSTSKSQLDSKTSKVEIDSGTNSNRPNFHLTDIFDEGSSSTDSTVGNEDKLTSTNDASLHSICIDVSDEDNLINYDPTPYDIAYPSPRWFSIQQLQSREYGKNTKFCRNRRTYYPSNSYWFRKYAYESLYFIQRMELMDELETHTGYVNCINFNKSGDLLCSGSDDLNIAIWNWTRSELKHKYHSGHSSNVFQCKWLFDNEHIASSARDGQIRLCNLRSSSTFSRKLAQHKGAAHELVLTAPQVILTCGTDALVYEIDLRVDKPTKLLFVRDNNTRVPLYSISNNKNINPSHIAVSGKSCSLRIYDRRYLPSASLNTSPSPAMTLCPANLSESRHVITCVVYNSTGSEILASYSDEDLYTFDSKLGNVIHVYRGHRNSETLKGCSWFSDNYVISGSDDGYIYAWDKESEHIVMSVFANKNRVVNNIEPHPINPIFASSGLDNNVKIWVPSTNEWPRTLKGIKHRIIRNLRERYNEQLKQISERYGDYESKVWMMLHRSFEDYI